MTSTDARNAATLTSDWRFEDAAFDRERQQQLVEILGRLQSDRVVAQKASRLGCRGKSGGDRARVGQRLQHRQTRRTRRRLCEAVHRLDDPVVFERPQGTGVHATSENAGERQTRRGNRSL